MNFDTCKREFERAGENYLESPDNYHIAEAALLAANATTLEEIAYRIEISIGCIEEVCCDAQEDIALLNRALVALRSGDSNAAIEAIDEALNGEPEYEFCYEHVNKALEELRSLQDAVIEAKGDETTNRETAQAKEIERLKLELANMTRSRDVLERQVNGLRRKLQAADAEQFFGERNRENVSTWRRMVQLCHPDKHGNSEAATAATDWLLQNKPWRSETT